MPTYSYKCDTCGHTFDAFQHITDDPLMICPVCRGELHRLISGGAGLIFKGSGFYITDYKNSTGPGGNGRKKPLPSESTQKKSDTTESSTTSSPKTENFSGKKEE